MQQFCLVPCGLAKSKDFDKWLEHFSSTLHHRNNGVCISVVVLFFFCSYSESLHEYAYTKTGKITGNWNNKQRYHRCTTYAITHNDERLMIERLKCTRPTEADGIGASKNIPTITYESSELKKIKAKMMQLRG